MKTRNNNSLMPTKPSLDEIISHFKMKPHIEGGFFSLFYEDPKIIRKQDLSDNFDGDRSCCNGIYFLIPKGIKTILHQLPMNEIWHFCLGDPLEIYEIDTTGQVSITTIGSELKAGHHCLHVVKKGNWFGTVSTGDYSLVTCTTSPGFKIQDFREGDRKALLKAFPYAKQIIVEFTHQTND